MLSSQNFGAESERVITPAWRMRNMNDDKFIQVLAKSNHSKVEMIRELLQSNERFAEIYEEYQLANTAFFRWQQLDGARSPNALQYCDLMTEREQELLGLLKHLLPPDGDRSVGG
jgi:hypothetical protein